METEEELEDIVYGIEHLRNLRKTDRDDLYSTFFKQISKHEEEVKKVESKTVEVRNSNIPYLDDVIHSSESLARDFRVKGTKFVLKFIDNRTGNRCYEIFHGETLIYMLTATEIFAKEVQFTSGEKLNIMLENGCNKLREYAKENGFTE